MFLFVVGMFLHATAAIIIIAADPFPDRHPSSASIPSISALIV